MEPEATGPRQRGGSVPGPPAGFQGERRRHKVAPHRGPPAPQSGSVHSGGRRRGRSQWDPLWRRGSIRAGPGRSRPTGIPRPEWEGPHRQPPGWAAPGWGRTAALRTWGPPPRPGLTPGPASAAAGAVPAPHPGGWRPGEAPWRVLCGETEGQAQGQGGASGE